MSTSGTYTFTVTQAQLVRSAMLNNGKLDAYDDIDPTEYSDIVFMLNMLVKQWQGKADRSPGLKVFSRLRGHLFLNGLTNTYTVGAGAVGWAANYTSTTLAGSAASGQAVIPVQSAVGIAAGDNFGFQYTSSNGNTTLYWGTVLSVNTAATPNTVTLTANLPTGVSGYTGGYAFDYTSTASQPIIVEAVVIRDSNLNDTPLQLLNQVEYDALPSKANPTYTADPAAVYFEYKIGNSVIYTDCGAANDTSKHLVITYLEAVQDITNPGDNPEYPQEWYLALSWGLSKAIAPMFEVDWTQLRESNYLEATAIARNKDPETTTAYFIPDGQS